MERREPFGAGLRSPAGHHHELVPLEHAGRDGEVIDLRELGAKRGKGVGHRPSIVDSSGRRPDAAASSVGRHLRLGIDADAVHAQRVIREGEQLVVAL